MKGKCEMITLLSNKGKRKSMKSTKNLNKKKNPSLLGKQFSTRGRKRLETRSFKLLKEQ
jgi:hypothetical protein